MARIENRLGDIANIQVVELGEELTIDSVLLTVKGVPYYIDTECTSTFHAKSILITPKQANKGLHLFAHAQLFHECADNIFRNSLVDEASRDLDYYEWHIPKIINELKKLDIRTWIHDTDERRTYNLVQTLKVFDSLYTWLNSIYGTDKEFREANTIYAILDTYLEEFRVFTAGQTVRIHSVKYSDVNTNYNHLIPILALSNIISSYIAVDSYYDDENEAFERITDFDGYAADFYEELLSGGYITDEIYSIYATKYKAKNDTISISHTQVYDTVLEEFNDRLRRY